MRKIESNELHEMLEKHRLWLNGDSDGVCADLYGADLRDADLRGANLRDASLRDASLYGADLCNANLRNADLRNADLRDADLRDADLRNADLRNANLRNADLSDANLRDADLYGAYLDFSCLPLWCGSLSAHFDDSQLKQIAYHLLKAGLQSKNATRKAQTELAKLIDFANGFHRADECGVIEKALQNGGKNDE